MKSHIPLIGGLTVLNLALLAFNLAEVSLAHADASDQGGGLGVGCGRDPTYARLTASDPDARVWLRDEQGHERTLSRPSNG